MDFDQAREKLFMVLKIVFYCVVKTWNIEFHYIRIEE